MYHFPLKYKFFFIFINVNIERLFHAYPQTEISMNSIYKFIG